MALALSPYKEAKMPKYIAKQSIGQFMPGEEIKGLDADRIQALLVSGAIEEYKEPDEPKEDGSASKLAELVIEVADLKANETKLTGAKDKAEKEVADLKAKVVDLEKTLAVSEKKVAAEAKKATTEPK